MTEKEAIKKHIEECEHRIGNILGFMSSSPSADISSCEENINVLKVVIIALEKQIKPEKIVIYGGNRGGGRTFFYQQGLVDGYNKAIDEFVKKFIYKAVCEGCSGCTNCYENEAQNICDDWNYYMKIAEQMKAGGENE